MNPFYYSNSELLKNGDLKPTYKTTRKIFEVKSVSKSSAYKLVQAIDVTINSLSYKKIINRNKGKPLLFALESKTFV